MGVGVAVIPGGAFTPILTLQPEPAAETETVTLPELPGVKVMCWGVTVAVIEPHAPAVRLTSRVKVKFLTVPSAPVAVTMTV
ncbi:hypothetical protein DRO33_02920 [Candidatus Bathyarchaeota archaeon]|nr:MAG: hypothetical protein DRO33_02920 [Candidatus Bathyarchaeota archaeon]